MYVQSADMIRSRPSSCRASHALTKDLIKIKLGPITSLALTVRQIVEMFDLTFDLFN